MGKKGKEYFDEDDTLWLKKAEAEKAEAEEGDDYYSERVTVSIFARPEVAPDLRSQLGNLALGVIFVAGMGVLALAFALAAEGRLDNVIRVLMN